MRDNILGVLVLIVILAMIVGLIYLFNTYTPCWFFSVKDAPVRCVVESAHVIAGG